MARSIHKDGVLQTIRDRRDLTALLTNPRNAQIVAEGSLMIYTDARGGRHQFSGLLPCLAATIWPEGQKKLRTKALKSAQSKAKQRARYRVGARGVDTSRAKRLRGGGGGSASSQQQARRGTAHLAWGMARGAHVHRQVEDAVVLDATNFRAKYGTLHPVASQILQTMERNGWISVVPEFCVYDEELRIATRFDHVCVKTDGTLVFLEYKTGYKDCFRATALPMAGPLRGVMLDSAENRALVQLAFSVLMVIRHFPTISRYEAWVVRPTESGVTKLYRLNEQFLHAHGPALYRYMCTYRK